jgi:uncharacterized protein (DUF1330 family)
MLCCLAPMPAYVIANIEVTDPDGYRAYAERVGATIAAHGGRYLARAGRSDVLEGDWQPARLVILEFPSIDAAHAWYASAEYAELRKVRVAHSRGQVVITDGLQV